MDTVDPPTWRALLHALSEQQNLSAEQTAWVVDQTVHGRAPTIALAGLLAALRVKGETAEELICGTPLMPAADSASRRSSTWRHR